MLSTEMIKELVDFEGKQFSDNLSATGSSLCLKVDTHNDKVYYQECYSAYSNFTGKNIYGNERTDKLLHPRAGLKTMTVYQFYGAAIGWV
jgi:hypothetical protein